MKRLLCILLSLFLLSGCGIIGSLVKDPVTFYYVRGDYQRTMDSIIVSEVREAAGHTDDLPYLLALYSMGPSDIGLKPAFPVNTRIIPTEHTEAGVVLSIPDDLEYMSDAEYTLASTCLALTCMELTEADQITVVSGGRSVTISPDNIITMDIGDQKQTEEAK